jgi:hypothetical protein
MKIEPKIGIIYFHQGWTDIINSLSLLNYYKNKYFLLYLFIRADSKPLIEYYIKGINIIPIYIEKEMLDQLDTIDFFNRNIQIKKYDILYHGGLDVFRSDSYRQKYGKEINKFFVEDFYTSYDIDYINRINYFIFDRNYELENKEYNKFINIYGNKYILSHHILESEIENLNNLPIINLAEKSYILFDYLQILINATEIFLLDSVWGAFIYLLDCKYKLFENKKITIYCKRGYNKMFTEPITLNNWIIL